MTPRSAVIVVVLVAVSIVGGTGLGAAVSIGSQAGVPAQSQAGSSVQIADFRGPTQANVGQTVTATATVRNTGTTAEAATVEYRIAGQVVSSAELTVAVGDSVTVTLRGTVPSLATGTYRQGLFVGSTGTGQSADLLVGSATRRFSVLSLEAPARASAGDRVSATATIENTVGTTETETFQYRIGTQVVATRRLTLSGGERASVTFEGTVPSLTAGRYLQGVFEGPTESGLTRPVTVSSSAASFSITNLQAPARAQVGEQITAVAVVRNTGEDRGATTLRYRVDGSTVATRSLSLDAGGRTTVSLEGTVPDRSPGSYPQGVFVGETSTGLTSYLTIYAQSGSFFRVSGLDAPVEAGPGDAVRVSARVTNDGTARGTVPIEYRVDGRVLASQRVDLQPDRSTEVSFDVTVPGLARGSYRQGVFVGSTERGQTTTLVVRAPTTVSVSNLVGPPAARAGDRVAVTVTVENTGTAAATERLEYRIGDRLVAEAEVSLAPGDLETVELSGTAPDLDPGAYRQGVFVDGVGPTTAVVISGADRTVGLAVTGIEAPSRASPGEEIAVRVTLRNDGEAPVEAEVQYRLGGEVLDAETVELLPGQTQTIEFTAEVPDLAAGSYEHGVFVGETDRGRTAELDVGARASPTPPGQTPPPTSTPAAPPGLDGFGFGVALVALALVVAALGRIRR